MKFIDTNLRSQMMNLNSLNFDFSKKVQKEQTVPSVLVNGRFYSKLFLQKIQLHSNFILKDIFNKRKKISLTTKNAKRSFTNKLKVNKIKKKNLNVKAMKSKLFLIRRILITPDFETKEIRCTCKNSECQKNYCQCYARGKGCNEKCHCFECKNKSNISCSQDESFKRDIFYCNCVNSGCSKNYCICKKNFKECNEKCKCYGCENLIKN